MRKLALLILFLSACHPTATLHPAIDATAQPSPDAAGALSLLRLDRAPAEAVPSIGVSDNYLYIASAGVGVYKMPKYGGALTAVDATPFDELQLAVGDSHVFWAGEFNQQRSVQQQPVTGGPTTRILDTLQAVQLQTDSDLVYFSTGLPGGQLGIDQLTSDGRTQRTLAGAVVGGVATPPDWIPADGHVYRVGEYPDASLHDFTVDAPPRMLAAFAPLGAAPQVAAVDATDVYAIGSTTVWRVPRAGGDPTIFYQTPDYPAPEETLVGFGVVDDNHLYVVSAISGRMHLRAIDKTTHAAIDLATAQKSGDMYIQVAQDAQNLFVVRTSVENDSRDTDIVLVPKTPRS
jgi:hypothetical protein